MKYYRLIQDNKEAWPSYEYLKIYKEDFKDSAEGFPKYYATVVAQDHWEEVEEWEYQLQEV